MLESEGSGTAAGPGPAAAPGIRLSEVLSALTYALDITEGQPEGHALRSCLIGMRLAAQIDLPLHRRAGLYYALLLKDLGCSSNAAKVCSLFGADDLAVKRGLKTIDWTSLPESFVYVAGHVAPRGTLLEKATRILSLGLKGAEGSKELFRTRCERGSEIARMLELPEATSDAIRALDEHWDGRGQPLGLKGDDIPLEGRILCLAQTVEVFFTERGVGAACDMARRRGGAWFDPELVEALGAVQHDARFWRTLEQGDPARAVAAADPGDRAMAAGQERLERVARAFAMVVDAKSPWTIRHSEGVAEIAVGIGRRLGLRAHELQNLRLASLLHDIGKLGVSNAILDKPGRLTMEERAQIQSHVEHTYRILHRVSGLRDVAEIAGSHHERLDGTGYWRGLAAPALSPAVRALVAADICEALMADRPYRKRLTAAQALELMRTDVGAGICPAAFEALAQFLATTGYTPQRQA
jgi:putative nucleotidyltransferase with HDIG domain